MKIALISEYNIFSTIGGTEYYLDILITNLCKSGLEVILVTKGKNATIIERKEVYFDNSKYAVFFIPFNMFEKPEVTQQVVSSSWGNIDTILKDFSPDIIHVHTLTTFFNIRHIELCIKQYNKVIFTSHVPDHFCAKHDLIQNNTRPCNGLVKPVKCSVCLFSKGIKEGLSNIVFQNYKKPLELLQRLQELQVYIISTSNWQKINIIQNGFNAAGVSVIRQTLNVVNHQTIEQRIVSPFLNIGFLGRLTSEKGSSLLFNVINELTRKDYPFRFILGIPPNSDKAEINKLKKIIQKHITKIILLDNINQNNKHEFFAQIDCLFIPSFVKETGPIVLLEALSYDKTVIAPDIGGPAEFADEFQIKVVTYKWNDHLSAVQALINNIKKPQITQKKIFCLENKEKSFTKAHIQIYEKMYKFKSFDRVLQILD